jgi:hypothetical protein
MFKSGKLLIVIINIIFLAEPVLASRIKTFLPQKSWQISIDANGFEPFDLFDQGTLLAGKTKDGIMITIVAEATKRGTNSDQIRQSHRQPTLSMFGRIGIPEEHTVNDIAVFIYQWGEPRMPKGVDETFNQVASFIKGKWSCNGYLVKEDIAFCIHLSGDSKRHSSKQLLEMMQSFRVEASDEIKEWLKLYQSVQNKPGPKGKSTIKELAGPMQNFARKYPANPDVRVLLGNYYLSTNQLDSAKKAYLDALERHRSQPIMILPELWLCYCNLGVCYVMSKDYDLGRHYLEKAHIMSKGLDKTDIAYSTYNLACLYAQKGEPNDSAKYLVKAIELDESWREQAEADSSFNQVRSHPKFLEAISFNPHKTESSGRSWSNEAGQWALGCAAVLNERNHGNHETLSPDNKTERRINDWKETLDKTWNDKSREDLLESLDWIEKGGHRNRFEYLGALIEGMSEEQYGAILESKIYDLEQLYEILIAKEYYTKLGEKSLLGWDYSRYICLCRWGYLVGWLSEQEAWEKIMPAAEILQKKFSSWEELGRNYIIGRMFWSYQETKDDGNLYSEAFQRLLEMKSSPWNKLAWAANLSGFEKPSEPNKPSEEVSK